ncbi:MAG: DUF4132 domain-containing protein, partial [Oscillospiraceae bacterium]|nr:DUF4132 domain-containing protein [Oscillospiraceae bacterium]
MDQMIQQIIEYSQKYKVYSEEEIKSIAEYLVGKNTFERVIPILAQPNETYYSHYYEHVKDIADGVKKDPSLFPRLGRYLKLLEYMKSQMYTRFVAGMIDNELSVADIFIKGGLGEESLLYYAASEINYKVNLKEVLEKVYETKPNAIINYLNGKDLQTRQRFPAAAFLLGKTGTSQKKQSIFSKIFGNSKNIDKIEEQFNSDMTASILVNLRVLHKGSLEKYLGALSAEDAKFFEHIQKSQNVNSFATDKLENISFILFRAFYFSDCKIETFNKRMSVLCSVDYTAFLNRLAALIPLKGVNVGNANNDNYLLEADEDFSEENEEQEAIEENEKVKEDKKKKEDEINRRNKSVADFLIHLTFIFKNADIDLAYLLAWAVGKSIYRPSVWEYAVKNYFLSGNNIFDSKVIERTEQIASPAEYMYLNCYMGIEIETAKAEKILIDMLKNYIETNFGDEHDELVISWLEGDIPEEELASVPPLGGVFGRANNNFYYQVNSPSFDFDMAVALIHDKSPVYARYLKYISFGGHIHRVKLQIKILSKLFNYAQGKIVEIIEKHVDVVQTVAKIAESSTDYYNKTKKFDKVFIETMIQKDPSVAVKAMETANADGRLYLFDVLYEKCPGYDPDFLISCLGDKSKKVAQHALAFLYPKKEYIEKIRPLLDAKKKDLRESAEKLMASYEGRANMGGNDPESGGEADIISYCTRNFPKGGMRSLVWAISGDLPAVRMKGSDINANEVIIQCYLYQYLTLSSIEIPTSANNIRAILNDDDLRKVSEQVYSQWINENSPTKHKSAALFFAVHANDANILILKKQIEDWADNSRGAIAAEAIKAMALGGSDLSLMTVDSMSRKFKNKQVMKAAKEAFALAAKSLGVSTESLGDRIIPTLDFNERGEKYIDYGLRKFKAIISADINMDITLEDENGKLIKSLPKPGVKDDVEIADREKRDFAALKKTLKTVAATQISRLEAVLSSCRKWTCEAWENLFIKNPIMHVFSTGLIWGIYDKNNKFTDTFRYMEDGSFTTVSEDEFDFDKVKGGELSISLPHPLDMAKLDPKLAGKWKQQLDDYNIVQPLVQLDRPIYKLEKDEEKQIVLSRFGGKKMLGITLLNKLQKLNWNRGSVQDGGGFSTMYKEDEDAKIGV